MTRFVRVETAADYFVEYDREDKCVKVYLVSSALRRKFNTPMLFSYNGRTWIKSSGGKSVSLGRLARALKLSEETVSKIMSLLET